MGKREQTSGAAVVPVALGCSAAYAALFLAFGVQLPFLPVWLDGRGFTSFEIGIISGAPLWARIVAGPLIANAADRRGAHRAAIVALFSMAAVSALLLSGAAGLSSTALLVGVMMIACQSALPLIDTIAIDAARASGGDFGRMRLWGSLAFIAANLGGGVLVAAGGSEAVIWMLVAAMALTALVSLALPAPATGDGTAEARGRFALADFSMLLGSRPFMLLVVAAGTVQASHAVYYGFSVLHWRSLGWSPEWIGLLWALGVIAEVALFAVSQRVVARLGAPRMLVIGAAAGIARWAAMAAEPGPGLAALLQTTHALTFGATYLATVHLIQQTAPAGRAGTAQALNAALSGGLATALALLLAGAAYERAGAAAYLTMSALAAVGLTAAWRIARRGGGQPS